MHRPSASRTGVFITCTYSRAPPGVTCSSTVSKTMPVSITAWSSLRYRPASSGKKSKSVLPTISSSGRPSSRQKFWLPKVKRPSRSLRKMFCGRLSTSEW